MPGSYHACFMFSKNCGEESYKDTGKHSFAQHILYANSYKPKEKISV
jgi:hypothetical protein